MMVMRLKNDIKRGMTDGVSRFQFKHPFTTMVVGLTSCGKTAWIKKLLQNVNTMVVSPPEKLSFSI